MAQSMKRRTSRASAVRVLSFCACAVVATGACFGRSDSKGGAGASFDAGEDAVTFDTSAPPDDGSTSPEATLDAPTEAATADLGRVWHELEEAGNCAGVWTRQGTTSSFSSVWASCGGTTATMIISIFGTSVTVQRTQDSGGNDCTYTGTLSADGLSVAGTYKCVRYQPPPPGAWSATIDYGAADAGLEAATDAPSGG